VTGTLTSHIYTKWDGFHNAFALPTVYLIVSNLAAILNYTLCLKKITQLPSIVTFTFTFTFIQTSKFCHHYWMASKLAHTASNMCYFQCPVWKTKSW